MPIIYCRLELHIPHCHSRKQKRNIVRKLTDRLRARFNFSVAEIGYQDLLQRGLIGAVSVGGDRMILEQLGRKLLGEAERTVGGDLVRSDLEIVHLDKEFHG